jgi:CHAD domain-containing protein
MNEEFLNVEEIKSLKELDELQTALTEGETAEEKRIISLLDSTNDESLRNTLSERLEEIQSANSVDIEEVIGRLESIGFTHASVLRHGITKIRQQVKWRAKNRGKE